MSETFSRDFFVQTGRLGGLTTASRHDPVANLAGARRGFRQKFERQVLEADPSVLGDEAEIARRADALQRIWMLRLSMKGVAARQAKTTR